MLSKTAEYALRTIACLAASPQSASAADEIAAKTQVPRRYLHRVLQDLGKAGIVLSRSGPGGGYLLACDPEEVTILSVVNAVSPLERIRHCPLGLPSHTQLCPLHQELDRAYAATEAAFGEVTIGEILRSTSSIIPLCDIPPDQITPPASHTDRTAAQTKSKAAPAEAKTKSKAKPQLKSKPQAKAKKSAD